MWHSQLSLLKIKLDEKNKMFNTMCKELKLVLGGEPGQQRVNVTVKDKNTIDAETVKKADDVFITFNGGGGGGGGGAGGVQTHLGL